MPSATSFPNSAIVPLAPKPSSSAITAATAAAASTPYSVPTPTPLSTASCLYPTSLSLTNIAQNCQPTALSTSPNKAQTAAYTSANKVLAPQTSCNNSHKKLRYKQHHKNPADTHIFSTPQNKIKLSFFGKLILTMSNSNL